MTTITVRTRAPRHTASRLERVLLDAAAALEGMALRHMSRRDAHAEIERRRDDSAEARRDAQAAAGIQMLPR